MSEFTKGELTVIDRNEYGDHYIGNGDTQKHIAIVVHDILSSVNVAKANAKELVRRWNALEKDGLVDELREACEDSLVDISEASVKFERGHNKVGQKTLTRVFRKIEAAIAKVS